MQEILIFFCPPFHKDLAVLHCPFCIDPKEFLFFQSGEKNADFRIPVFKLKFVHRFFFLEEREKRQDFCVALDPIGSVGETKAEEDKIMKGAKQGYEKKRRV